MTTEFQLNDPPTDGITSVSFNKKPSSGYLLMVTSWDKSVRVYDTRTNVLRDRYSHEAGALDACWNDDGTKIASGGVDFCVRMHDLNSGDSGTIGRHESGVRCIEWAGEIGAILSAGWDSVLHMWDARTSTSKPVATSSLIGKAFTMSMTGSRLVLGMSGRHVWIYDVRNVRNPQFENSFAPNSKRAAFVAILMVKDMLSGRVSMEYFDPSDDVQAKKYAFKCHRAKKPDGSTLVYPVNAMSFHPTHGTFATGGCDGTVCTWDGQNRKRLSLFKSSNYAPGVAALDFNHDGSKIAIAASYTFEEGEKEHEPDNIFIRDIADVEVKSRARKK